MKNYYKKLSTEASFVPKRKKTDGKRFVCRERSIN